MAKSSDRVAAHKTAVVNGASSSFLEDNLDRSPNVGLARNQELGVGSVLGEALMPEKAAVPEAKRSSLELQASEDVSGVARELSLLGSSEFGKLLGCNGRNVTGEAVRVDGCDGEGGLLGFKKQQLLDELEGGNVFRGGIGVPEERTLLIENLPDGCLRRSLKIEMIDDTAVIEPIVGHIVEVGKNNSKEEPEGKMPKRAKGKPEAGVRASWKRIGGPAQVSRKNKGDGAKRIYSKKEMEALRFAGSVEQSKLWKMIFNGLGPEVQKEYLSLVGPKYQPQGNYTSEASKPFRSPRGPGILGAIGGPGRADPFNAFVLPNILRTLYSTQ